MYTAFMQANSFSYDSFRDVLSSSLEDEGTSTMTHYFMKAIRFIVTGISRMIWGIFLVQNIEIRPEDCSLAIGTQWS